MDNRPTEGQAGEAAGAGGYPRAKGDRSNRSTLKRKVNYLVDRDQTDVTARSDEIEQGREGLQSCELGKGVRRGRVQVIWSVGVGVYHGKYPQRYSHNSDQNLLRPSPECHSLSGALASNGTNSDHCHWRQADREHRLPHEGDETANAKSVASSCTML